jgi:hypothetical protein
MTGMHDAETLATLNVNGLSKFTPAIPVSSGLHSSRQVRPCPEYPHTRSMKGLALIV